MRPPSRRPTRRAPPRVLVTPPLPLAKARYLQHGISQVEGWLQPSAAAYLGSLEVLQRGLAVRGDVCEIGVHHGKSFLCLALGLPESERAVAIDLFEDQDLNLDRSGAADRDVFTTNLRAHGGGDNVVIVKADSARLGELGFLGEGRRFRLFSIDGGHSPELTRNDLFVAEQTVVERAVVMLDDYLNPHWLGVITGLFSYWSEGGSLVPMAGIPGKLLLAATADAALAYRELLGDHFAIARTKRAVPLGHGQLDIFGAVHWIVQDELGGRAALAGAPLARRIAASMPPGIRRLGRPAVRFMRRLGVPNVAV